MQDNHLVDTGTSRLNSTASNVPNLPGKQLHNLYFYSSYFFKLLKCNKIKVFDCLYLIEMFLNIWIYHKFFLQKWEDQNTVLQVHFISTLNVY